MEATVDKLGAMFQKSEADLELIERRLKLDYVNNVAENGGLIEEIPAMLENLRSIRIKHAALGFLVKKNTAAQKESMESIQNSLTRVMDMLQHLQQTTNVEVHPAVEVSIKQQPQNNPNQLTLKTKIQ